MKLLPGADRPSSETQLAGQIETAQTHAVIDNILVSLFFNCVIAFTTAAILGIDRPNAETIVWLAVVIVVNIVRAGFAISFRKNEAASRQPKEALRHFSIGAFVSGVLWGVAPLIAGGGGSVGGYVIFIVSAISAGACIQSTAFAGTAIAFSLPALTGAIAVLLYDGTLLTALIAFDVVMMGGMMIRSAFVNQAKFVASQTDRLKAISLADSLVAANGEINTHNRQLEILANRDPLTGLGNRAAFNLRLASCLRPGEPAALLVVDLDRFKQINDTLGHGAGDAVLIEFGARLSGLILQDAFIGRLGGDEFAVIFEGPDAGARAQAFGIEILALAARPVMIADRPAKFGASVGLALYPDHGDTADDIFACADIALYCGKDQGGRCLATFDPAMRMKVERQKKIETGLEPAISNGEVRVFFQPQVDLADGSVIGFEALIRWTHRELGPISPPEIVEAAYAIHASETLTRHVALAASNLLLTLPEIGLAGVPVAINVSPREVVAYSISTMLEGVARASRIDPSLLEIEITEEAILDPAAASEELAKLESAGFRVAIDDFGMGHSSLAYLLKLRVDRLKIDRSFVNGIATSHQNRALVSALVGIGRTLAIDIVAEGVETQEDAAVLRLIGCRSAQGYLFARPMPVDDLPGWLAGRDQSIGIERSAPLALSA